VLSSQLLNATKRGEAGRRGRKRGAWGEPQKPEGEKRLQEAKFGNVKAVWLCIPPWGKGQPWGDAAAGSGGPQGCEEGCSGQLIAINSYITFHCLSSPPPLLLPALILPSRASH